MVEEKNKNPTDRCSAIPLLVANLGGGDVRRESTVGDVLTSVVV